MKRVSLLKPFKSIAPVLSALLALSASAQIGGSGWTPQTVTFNVQWPYNVAESSRYTVTDGVYHMLTYNTDAPFSMGSTTLPRTEQRFTPDYTGGDNQYQAMLMCPGNESQYTIFQIHTGDAEEGTFGPTPMQLHWYDTNGGSVVAEGAGKTIATNLAGQWFQLNVDHNLVTHTITVWINNALVWTQKDSGATDYYFKDGVYMAGGGTLEMDTYVQDIQMWTSSGQGGTSSVADPVFSPGAGTYTSAQTVSIGSATSGASFRYTTDGSTPSETAGTFYSSPVSISGNTTLKAIAYKAGSTDSNVVSATYAINPPPQAAAPTFSPGTGTYTSAQNVAITSATSNVTIHYTTDGSMPNETVGTVYSGPVNVSAIGITTINAIAFEAGFTDSTVTSAAYTINPPPQAAAPTFSPGAGTYTSVQNVAITSTTGGVTIRYTTDGSAPSETNGTVYLGSPVSIGSTATLQAIAYESGYTDSNVTSGVYTINLPQAAAPVFSPAGGTYTSAQAISINSATSGVSIHYTTDGSTPSETAGTIYSGPVSIDAISTTTLKAIAYKVGFIDSTVTSAAYTINPPPQAAAPTFSPGAGTYTSVQNVAITSTIGGVTIRYTTDGSAPSETNGTVYLGSPVSIGSTATLRAIAYEAGYIDSNVASGVYTINLPQAAGPVFSPTGGTYTSAQTVSISSATSGVSIHYTTDGSTPSATAGTIYSGAVSISGNTTLNAIASKAGFINSTVTSATYTITRPPPTLNFEAESMSPVGTGATVSISNDTNASGGVLEFLNSTAVGQSITFTTPSVPAGTYQIQLRYKTNTSRAQHNVKIDGTQVGGTIDQYATTQAYLTATLGKVTFATTGTHKIVLTVTGKDSAATHDYISADKFTFVGQ